MLECKSLCSYSHISCEKGHTCTHACAHTHTHTRTHRFDLVFKIQTNYLQMCIAALFMTVKPENSPGVLIRAWINKLRHISMQWNTIQRLKGMNYWYWPKPLIESQKHYAEGKNPDTEEYILLWFHLYGVLEERKLMYGGKKKKKNQNIGAWEQRKRIDWDMGMRKLSGDNGNILYLNRG